MKIIAIADLHITCLKKLLKNHAYDRAEKALNELLILIWYIEPDTILISGDIFNSPYPSRDEIHLFTQFLLPLLKEEINVLIIPGNHDSDREGGKTAISFLEPFDKAIENFYIAIDQFRCVQIDNIAFCMWPWGILPSKDNLHKIENTNCKKRIGMSHITLSGTKIAGDGRQLRKGYSIKHLQEAMELFRLDYMFLGDIHEYQEVVDNAFYSGSIYQTKSDESTSKGILYLDTEKNKVSFQEIHNVPKLLTIEEDEINNIDPENFYTLKVDSKDKVFSISNAELPSNIVKIKHPFGKEITNKNITDSNRKVGFSISIPLIMLKVLRKQNIKDINGTIKYLLNLTDSKKDLILP